MSIDTLGRRAAAQVHRQVAQIDVEAALTEVTGQHSRTRWPTRRVLAATVAALVVCAAAVTGVVIVAGNHQVGTALHTSVRVRRQPWPLRLRFPRWPSRQSRSPAPR